MTITRTHSDPPEVFYVKAGEPPGKGKVVQNVFTAAAKRPDKADVKFASWNLKQVEFAKPPDLIQSRHSVVIQLN